MITPYYRDKLTSLNVDRSHGHPKPHKVCLLLAILDLIRENKLSTNEIRVNKELKSAFSRHFAKLQKGNDAENILLPFYHLRTEGFWHFQVTSGEQEAFDELVASGGPKSERALFNVIDCATLDSELFQAFQTPQGQIEARELLLENLEDLSVQFHRWLLEVGKSERTAKSYVGAIQGSISTWAADADISKQNLISIQSYTEINQIAEQIAEYDVFIERNTRGRQMYSAALSSYQGFLAATCQAQLTEDIEKIVSDNTVTDTQKARLVNTRIGQGQFREDLIKYWKGCAVTGYPGIQFLVASHIKPWRVATDEERLNKYNGILLLPNLDKVFDLGYITFEDDGSVRVSEFIEEPKVLGIRENLTIALSEQHHEYMEHHRNSEFEKKLQ